MASYKIAWLPGDGVGNDVMEAARIVLDALKFDAEYIHGDIGWEGEKERVYGVSPLGGCSTETDHLERFDAGGETRRKIRCQRAKNQRNDAHQHEIEQVECDGRRAHVIGLFGQRNDVVALLQQRQAKRNTEAKRGADSADEQPQQ